MDQTTISITQAQALLQCIYEYETGSACFCIYDNPSYPYNPDLNVADLLKVDPREPLRALESGTLDETFANRVVDFDPTLTLNDLKDLLSAAHFHLDVSTQDYELIDSQTSQAISKAEWTIDCNIGKINYAIIVEALNPLFSKFGFERFAEKI